MSGKKDCIKTHTSHNKRKYFEENMGDDFDSLVDFNKEFKFDVNNCVLPEASICFTSDTWQDEKLQCLKDELNTHKSKLDNLDLEEWGEHTKRRNPAGDVNRRIRQKINPEFLTQAWTKFYECAHRYDIVPEVARNAKKLVSLHLCEAPGAFITSLNHYLKLKHEHIQWEWRATTLNPYYEGNSPSHMICDDRFMFHTLQRWDFGTDQTGNLMDWNNSKAIINNTKQLGEVLLVTADGSVDCVERPGAQEEVTSPLHYCEIVTALQTLATGGTFIFKLFTMFEHSTVNIMYFVCGLFEQVNIFKPLTSKHGNSEVYAVCLSYKGSCYLEPYIPNLKSAFGKDLYYRKAFFPKDIIPQTFMEQIQSCANKFSSIQRRAIDYNLNTFRIHLRNYKNLKINKDSVSQKFMEQYELSPITYDQEIVKGKLHEVNNRTLNMNPKFNKGSYTQRLSYDELTPGDKVDMLEATLHRDITELMTVFLDDDFNLNLFESVEPIDMCLEFGKPIQYLNSSKFIFAPIMKLYRKIVAEEQFRAVIFSDDSGDSVAQPQPQQQLQHLVEETHYLSFKDYNHKEKYHKYETKCFRSLVQTLKHLKIGDHLHVYNMSLLTHFNVGLVNILSKNYFESVNFIKDGPKVLFCNFKGTQFSELDQISTKLDTNDITILKVLPVTETNIGELYDCILLYNNTFYRQKCTQFLKSLKNSL